MDSNWRSFGMQVPLSTRVSDAELRYLVRDRVVEAEVPGPAHEKAEDDPAGADDLYD